MIYQAQSMLSLVLGVAALVMEVWALVDCLRRREDAFRAAGKLTKPAWLAILALACCVGFIFVQAVFGMLSLVAVVAAAVYHVDVRPALDRVMGRGRGDGPYGPW